MQGPISERGNIAPAKHQRYVYLDALRGLAAILVLTRHTPELWGFQLFRSYLSVDIFFILSGFVLASAYGKDLSAGRLSTARFMGIRIIRLYPTYLLSFLLCVAVLLLNIEGISGIASPAEIIATILLTSLLIPSNLIGGGALFFLNGPYWSLLYEMVFNYFYAMGKARLLGYWQAPIILVFAALVTTGAVRSGNLDIGSNFNAGSLLYGSARAAFGIFFGACLFGIHARLGDRLLKWRALRPASLAIVMLILCSPSFPGIDWLADLVAVFLVFPACVLVAAGGTEARLGNFFELLGAASYPLYLLHVPARNLLQWFAKRTSIEWATPLTGMVFAASLVLVCVWVERAYDLPIRSLLRRRYLPSDPLKRSS